MSRMATVDLTLAPSQVYRWSDVKGIGMERNSLSTQPVSDRPARPTRGILGDPFSGALAECYAAVVQAAKWEQEWFVDTQLETRTEAVLDLCCGAGRMAHHLAHAGASVTGVDISPDMLAAAHSAMDSCPLSHEGIDVSFIRGDALSIRLPRLFDIVVIGGLSVTLFDMPQRAALFQSARRLLAPGGALLFDYLPLEVSISLGKAGVVTPMTIGGVPGTYSVGSITAARLPRKRFTTMSWRPSSPATESDVVVGGLSFDLFTFEELRTELTAYGFLTVTEHDMQAVAGGQGPLQRWIRAVGPRRR